MSLLLVPVLVHVAGLALATVPRAPQPVAFDLVDFLVTLVVVAYLALCVYLAGCPGLVGRAVAAVYSLLLALVAAECVFGVLASRAKNLPLVPASFVTYPGKHLPGCHSPAKWTVNRYGVRGPDAAPASFDHAILCVGGSTTECFYVNDEDTWPWQLGTRLTAALDEPVYAGNAGKAGHSVAQHAYLLKHYSYIHDFDVVVLFVGFNDLHRILAPGAVRPFTPNEVFPGGAVTYSPWAIFSESSFYYRNLATSRRLRNALCLPPPQVAERVIVQDPASEYVIERRKQRQAALRRQPLDELPNIADDVELYRADLRQAIIQCQINGQIPIVMTQPTLYREDLPRELDALIWVTLTGRTDCAYTSKALAKGMATINAATMEVCREADVPCLDLVPIVPQDTTAFCDQCHLNDAGCHLVAEALAQFIVEEKILGPAQADARR